MKNIALVIICALVISGCITAAKEVKPSSEKAINVSPSMEEKNASEARKVFSSNARESEAPTPVSMAEFAPYNMPKPIPEPAKMRYSQITNLISEFIDIKDNNAIPGGNNYSGISENKLKKTKLLQAEHTP